MTLYFVVQIIKLFKWFLSRIVPPFNKISFTKDNKNLFHYKMFTSTYFLHANRVK